MVTLTEASYTIGSDPSSADIGLDDAAVSRVHAILERVGATWLVRDLGSRNGTRLGRKPLSGQRRLRDGEEIFVGRTWLVFRDAADARAPRTHVIEGPPTNLTRMEQKVLDELCHPLATHNTFQPPASVSEIAARLFIGKMPSRRTSPTSTTSSASTKSAGTADECAWRTRRCERGAVTMGDLEEPPDEGRVS